MIDLIKLITFASILVLGVRVLTSDGMLLYPLRQWAEAKSEKEQKWLEPLFLCVWCMPSLYTGLGYLFAFLTGVVYFFPAWHYIFLYPMVAMGSSVVCGLIWTVYERLSTQDGTKADYYKAATKYYDKAEQQMFLDIKDRKEKYHKRKEQTNNGKF